MMQFITLFANTEAATEAAAEQSIFAALGIDWRMLLLQIIAFVILLWVLGKFVYPPMVKAIDNREKAIAESIAAANNAEEQAEKTQEKIEKLFREAREESSQVIESAHKEAAILVKDAEDRAKKRADQIIADTRVQLEQDIAKARQELRTETIQLVALATETIVREKVDTTRDATLISKALEEAQQA